MNKNAILAIGVLVLVLGGVGVWYISSKSKTPEPNLVVDTVIQGTPVSTLEPTVVVEGAVKEVTVEGGQFKFAPNEIKVKLGDKVKVTFKNVEGFHDFVIDEFSAKTAQIAAGKEETIEFTADKVGTFEYYCSVGKHRQMGMVGKLIVE